MSQTTTPDTGGGTQLAVASARVPSPSEPARPSTTDLKAVRVQRTGDQRDPLDDVVDRVRRGASGAVDPLQVAALLEAEGVTDQIARSEYGLGDVFVMADTVYRRLGGLHSADRPVPLASGGRCQAWRDASHGLLYLLPSAVFPAVLAFIEGPSVIAGLILAGGAGWLLAGAASWLAYQLLGRGDARTAGRVLIGFTAAGLLIAALLGAAVGGTTDGGGRVIVFAVGAMAYQMSSTLLTFYHRELWLAAAMAPAAMIGLGYAVVRKPALPTALAAGAVCVAVSLALAVFCAVRSVTATGAAKQARPLRALLHGRILAFTLVLVYTALSAAYLLLAQAPYLLDRFDIVVTAVPLMLGMGVVEWRARRFTELARDLLHRVHYPREFVRRVWIMLVGNVLACTGVVALAATALLLVLDRLALLSAAAVMMAATYAILAGGYLITFLLAGHGRYGSLSAALATALAIHVIGITVVMPRAGALADTMLFLASAVVLQILLLLAMIPVAGQVWRHT